MVGAPCTPDPDHGDLLLARGGDGEAFARITQRSAARLRAVLGGILRDPHLVEDALQEAWLQAWLNLELFAGRGRLQAWLRTIATREAWRLLRRRGEVGSLPYAAEAEPSCDAPGPEAGLEARDELAWATASLRPQARAAVLLTAGGWSYAEVAAYLGAPLGTVGVWVHRSRPVLERVSLERAASRAL